MALKSTNKLLDSNSLRKRNEGNSSWCWQDSLKGKQCKDRSIKMYIPSRFARKSICLSSLIEKRGKGSVKPDRTKVQRSKSHSGIWEHVCYLICVLDVEGLSRRGNMPHNALVPLQPDAVTGRLLQRGSLGDIKEAADQEFPVGAVLAHLGPAHRWGIDRKMSNLEMTCLRRKVIKVN